MPAYASNSPRLHCTQEQRSATVSSIMVRATVARFALVPCDVLCCCCWQEHGEQRLAALVVRCGMVWEEVRKHRSAAHMPSC